MKRDAPAGTYEGNEFVARPFTSKREEHVWVVWCAAWHLDSGAGRGLEERVRGGVRLQHVNLRGARGECVWRVWMRGSGSVRGLISIAVSYYGYQRWAVGERGNSTTWL